MSDRDYQFLTASQQKANEILNQIVWELVSPLCVDEVSLKVAEMIKRLQEVSGDYSLTLLDSAGELPFVVGDCN